MSDLDKISSSFEEKINSVKSKEELQNLKTEFFGKNGEITKQFKSLGSIEAAKKKELASSLNKLKDGLTNQLEKKFVELETLEVNEKLEDEKLDVTLPIRSFQNGKIHPVSQVIDEITSIFSEIGFSVAEGPDVETEYNNFTALNTPEDHPARDMHDTFYLEENKKILLRTHTSPVQIRTMLNEKPPFKIIVPGRTYRCDSDQTHAPMFHQLEGLHIDKNITMSHLKGCLDYFIKEFFEVKNVKMRFRPSHFPFTEPSAEVDIGYRIENDKIVIGEGDKWLEIWAAEWYIQMFLETLK
jgi:phenylalanyl-tRNA synthetase alpha chain